MRKLLAAFVVLDDTERIHPQVPDAHLPRGLDGVVDGQRHLVVDPGGGKGAGLLQALDVTLDYRKSC